MEVRCTINRHPTVPFTLNYKPTRGGLKHIGTSRAGEPARLESGVVPPPCQCLDTLKPNQKGWLIIECRRYRKKWLIVVIKICYTHFYLHTHIRLSTHTHTSIYTHTYVYLHTHTSIYTHTYVYLHTHTSIYTHTYVYLHTHIRLSTHPSSAHA